MTVNVPERVSAEDVGLLDRYFDIVVFETEHAVRLGLIKLVVLPRERRALILAVEVAGSLHNFIESEQTIEAEIVIFD